MTDKEKLEKVRAEVERLMKDVEIHSDIGDIQQDSYYDGRRSVLCLIRDFINSLPEEPVSEEQVKESLISKHEDKTCKENGDYLTQEPISDDLEEAIEQYCVKHGYISIVDGYYTLQEKVSDIARHFANWQKQKETLSLTIEDIKTIDRLLNRCVDCNNPYQEVLKQFKDLKK